MKRAATPVPSVQPPLLLLRLLLLLPLLHPNLWKKKTKHYFFVFSTRTTRGRTRTEGRKGWRET